jgi:hypothetical protein
LILFGLHHTNQLLFSCQGSVSPLTGERCPPLSSRTRLNVQLPSTKRPGSPPGRELTHAFQANIFNWIAESPTSNPSYILSSTAQWR